MIDQSLGNIVTETPSIDKLALWVAEGRIVLPRFQRPFVWRKPEIISLLESIEANYPIGSVLLWQSHSQEIRVVSL